jgi:hypothetical protein
MAVAIHPALLLLLGAALHLVCVSRARGLLALGPRQRARSSPSQATLRRRQRQHRSVLQLPTGREYDSLCFIHELRHLRRDRCGRRDIANATSSSVTSAPFATAFGYQALGNATSSLTTSLASNTAFGYQALQGSATNFEGNNNSAFGYQALNALTTGSNNIGIGSGALKANGSGGSNVAIGGLAAEQTSNNNTAVGISALNNITFGNGGNTAIWQNAGLDDSQGNNAVFIGSGAPGWQQVETVWCQSERYQRLRRERSLFSHDGQRRQFENRV